MIELPPGPLIIGIEGTALDAATAETLQHPAVGGVILFARNYASPEQLAELTAAIAALRSPRLLITVDQEGGRVQRFRDGFTALPPLGVLGRWYASHPDRACDLAYRHGRIMAAEVLGHGVDLSWAPVLDLDRGSTVIGDRALAADPAAVSALGSYYLAGMRDAGMAGCAKHFPGHGSVAADSHDEVVTDPRPADALHLDREPFSALVGQCRAVMMAHVRYPAVDEAPAGYSRAWIETCLKGELGFEGLVVSDDLDMVGASTAGNLEERLQLALSAGCHMVLVCRPESASGLLARIDTLPGPPPELVRSLHGRALASLAEQSTVPEFNAWRESLKMLSEGA